MLTLKHLITDPAPEGLGYCCMYAFFRLYRQTAVIALRLGVTERAVRKHKQRYKEKALKCEGCENCMLKALRRNLK